jgi:two-component system sensor histidine kinase PilS (NtrC family)
VRNPLAAIAQANALMLEDAMSADQHRLARMVADNVERLKRIVDDVMAAVSPGAIADVRPLDAVAEVAAAGGEWARTAQLPLGPASRLRMVLPESPLPVLFDAEHLRRVLVNLLDNARRHASEAPGAIALTLQPRDRRTATLAVASDGEPIPLDVERYLFEPFFSTRSRGTGLGLYICRELCARYDGSIEYRPHGEEHRHRNEFVVTMRRAEAQVSNPDPQK